MEENRSQSANKASSSADNVSRLPLVTRHAPNQQMPAQQPLEQQQQPALQQQTSQVSQHSCTLKTAKCALLLDCLSADHAVI